MTIKLRKERVENLDNYDEKYDLIYIDPPFGLDREFFMFEENKKVSFDDKWESTDAYIEWYATVVQDCFEALKPNGWLYCHNNFDSNALLLGALTKEVRGKFYTNISWKRSGPKNNIKKGWGNIVDSIMTFRKGDPYFDVEYQPLDPTYEANSFKNKDEKGFYALGKLTGEKSRPGKKYEYNGYEPEYGWRFKEDKTRELDEQGLIHWGKNLPYKKIYLSESKGSPIQNFWDDIYFISRSEKNKRKYPTQKPVKLLERIIKSSCPKDGVVFDPFCGSGTTAIASFNLDRDCTVCDVSDEALKITQAALVECGAHTEERLLG